LAAAATADVFGLFVSLIDNPSSPSP